MPPLRHLLYWIEGPSGDDCGYDANCPPSPAPSPAPFLSPFPSPAPSPAAIVVPAYGPNPFLPGAAMNPDGKPQLLRTLVIVVASVLATCALLLTYYAILRRYRSFRRRGAHAAPPPPPPQPPADADDELRQDLLAAGGGEGDPYHVWHIRTAGLDEGTIGAITAVRYRRGEGLVEGTDCAVCLGEFRDGDMLRLLPKCSHAFHIPCIDTWLRSHLNCPLCRAPILAPPPSPPPAADSTSLPSSSPSPSLPSSAAAAATAVDRPGFSVSPEESEVWMRIDLGNGGSESEEDGRGAGSGAPPAGDRGNRRAALQQVRRSVSMDPSALGGLLRRMGLVGAAGEDGRKPTSEEHPSAAKEGGERWSGCGGAPMAGAGAVEMERSMSSGGGGGLFLSRFSGRTRGGILPL